MLASLTLSFLLLPPSTSAPTEPTPAEAQRAVAEAHVERRAYAEAGEAYLKLASMSGAVRRDELDRAHVNLDSAYLTSNLPRYLCRALQVAEMTIAEGAFEGEQEAKFWQDTRDDDLRRLAADARATKRENCRFGSDGGPLKVAVAYLPDAEVDQTPLLSATSKPAAPLAVTPTPAKQRPSAERRWRAQTAAGAVLVGAGLGSLGLLAGVLDAHRRQAQAMEQMNETAKAAGGFSMAGLAQHDRIYADALLTRSAAIGLGVVSAATLTTGIALLVSRRVTRAVALQPYGGLHGGGATLRLKF